MPLAFPKEGCLCHSSASDMFEGRGAYLIACRPQNRRVEAELPWRDGRALNGVREPALAGAEKRNVLGRIFLYPLLWSDILTACLEDPETPAGECFHHGLSAWHTNTCTLTVEGTHEGGLMISSSILFLWCRPGCTGLLSKHWPLLLPSSQFTYEPGS